MPINHQLPYSHCTLRDNPPTSRNGRYETKVAMVEILKLGPARWGDTPDYAIVRNGVRIAIDEDLDTALFYARCYLSHRSEELAPLASLD